MLECFHCKGKFEIYEMKFAKPLDNMHVAGFTGNKIPQCPKCNAVAFFGFTAVKKSEPDKPN